jgi:hypothetical protein
MYTKASIVTLFAGLAAAQIHVPVGEPNGNPILTPLNEVCAFLTLRSSRKQHRVVKPNQRIALTAPPGCPHLRALHHHMAANDLQHRLRSPAQGPGNQRRQVRSLAR